MNEDLSDALAGLAFIAYITVVAWAVLGVAHFWLGLPDLIVVVLTIAVLGGIPALLGVVGDRFDW